MKNTIITKLTKAELSSSARKGYYWTSRVLLWMSRDLGYKLPKLGTSFYGAVNSVWSKFGPRSDTRSTLDKHKTVRNWFMKVLGATGEERRFLLSKPPKGVYPWMFTVLAWIRKENTPENRKRLRWVTTLLFSTRTLTLKPNPSFDPITEEPTYNAGWVFGLQEPLLKRSIVRFWRSLGFKRSGYVPKKTMWTKYHLTYKAGPKGPALEYALEDWLSLPDDLKRDLKIIGGERFEEFAQMLDDEIPGVNPGTPIRRLSYFSDLEGKTRVIAILDYFSQTILRPLHLWIFRILARIPQDCTFHQSKFKELTKDWDMYYSCDLTNATDRFPIALQEVLFRGLFPESWVSAWRRIMAGYPFNTDRKDSKEGRYYYSTGNPMGSYSSWAVFTLSHHFIMFHCCERLGLRWEKAKYCILGDDVLIGDKRLYLEYRRCLRELGVEVSIPKSHESPFLYEFAKRWVYFNTEVTPLPIPAFVQGKASFHLIVPLLIAEQSRGLELTSGVTDAYIRWYKVVKGLPYGLFFGGPPEKSPLGKKSLASLRQIALATECIAKFYSGLLTPEQAINSIAHEYGAKPLVVDGDTPYGKHVIDMEYGLFPFTTGETKLLLKTVLQNLSKEMQKVPKLVQSLSTPNPNDRRPPTYRTSWEVLMSRAGDYEGQLRDTTLGVYLFPDDGTDFFYEPNTIEQFYGPKASVLTSAGFEEEDNDHEPSDTERCMEALVYSDVDFVPWFSVWSDLVKRYTEYNLYESQPPKTQPPRHSANHARWVDYPWRSPLILRAAAMPSFDATFKGRKEMIHSVIAGKFAKAISKKFRSGVRSNGRLKVTFGTYKYKPVEIEFELR